MRRQLSRRTFLQGSAAVGLATPIALPNSSASWDRRAEMPIGRSETPAAVLDGCIYVVGGFGADTAAHRYDPVMDTWERITDYPQPVNHSGIVVLGDRLIVGGGYSADGSSAYSDIHAYDSGNNGWERLGDLPMPMGAFGFAVVEETLYLVGGAAEHLGGPPQDMVARWEETSGAWEPLAPLSHPREHLAVVAQGGAIYAVGGRAHNLDEAELGAEASRYDLEEDRWDELPALPAPRSGLSGAPACDGLVVIGGETSKEVFNEVDFLELDRMEWRPLAQLPVARHGIAVAVIDDVIYAIGGSTEAGRVANVTSSDALPLTCEATGG